VSGGDGFQGDTLSVTAVPTEQERARRFVARMARDAEDEALLLDVVFNETKVMPPKGCTSKPAAKKKAAAPKGEPKADKPLRKHGTPTTYRWELANGIDPCRPCRDAVAALKREARAELKRQEAEAAKASSKCGTLRGYRIHLEKHETACQPCCDANAATSRRYRPGPTKRRAANTECGTDGGYQKHMRRHKKACQPCKDAHAEALRDYRAKKKVAA